MTRFEKLQQLLVDEDTTNLEQEVAPTPKYQLGQKVRLTTDLFYISEDMDGSYGGLMTREKFEDCTCLYLEKGAIGEITMVSDDGSQVEEVTFADHTTGLGDDWFEMVEA